MTDGCGWCTATATCQSTSDLVRWGVQCQKFSFVRCYHHYNPHPLSISPSLRPPARATHSPRVHAAPSASGIHRAAPARKWTAAAGALTTAAASVVRGLRQFFPHFHLTSPTAFMFRHGGPRSVPICRLHGGVDGRHRRCLQVHTRGRRRQC